MDPIERLSSLFERFPGIGPRQASRFVQFLLRGSPAMRREVAAAIQDLGSGVCQCPRCMRFHAGREKICGICSNPQRDQRTVLVVASDTDLSALERSGTYSGHYFVLGGTVPLGGSKNSDLRTQELLESLPERIDAGLSEVILAFPANPEGDATSQHIHDQLENIAQERSLSISSLGRGLSTGSELEYADPDTIRAALANRR